MEIELLSKEEKLKILKTIELDPEFRQAILGAIGYKEVLSRIADAIEELRKLREDFNRMVSECSKRFEVIEKKLFEHDNRFLAIEEELKRLREDFNKLYQKSLEHDKRFEVLEKKLLEYDKRFEAIERKLLEHDKRFEVIEKRLEEHARILQEHSKVLIEHSKRIEELVRAVGELKAAVGSIGRRMGRDLERLILNLYRDAIQRFGIDVEKIEKKSFRDYDGRYLQRGAKIELDIYMSDEKAYLIEVKSFVDEDDVEWFNTKCWIMARELGLENYSRLIVAVNITREAIDRAKELGIDVVYGSIIE